MKFVDVAKFKIGPKKPLTVICGPCVIESKQHAFEMADSLKSLFGKLGINLIFKASYDKANRSAFTSFRGPGIEEGLEILSEVKAKFDLPVTSDVHLPEEAPRAAQVLDLLQIPAFLCRQTDLVHAVAKTGKPVSVKKGQFLAPWDMKNVVKKIEAAGNENIILIERGASFGYNNLVFDPRSIPLMRALGYPVCFDATHSAQLPGGQGETTGGQRDMIPTLAKAAVAAGADMLFMEAHNDPDKAKSDSATVLNVKQLPELLSELKSIYHIVQGL